MNRTGFVLLIAFALPLMPQQNTDNCAPPWGNSTTTALQRVYECGKAAMAKNDAAIAGSKTMAKAAGEWSNALRCSEVEKAIGLRL